MTGQVVVDVLRALERYYDATAEDVTAFLRLAEASAAGREALLLREDPDDASLEIALVLPERLVEEAWPSLSFDERCQLVEGASHFLVVCERARQERSTTHLELELQAEVDKWLVLSRGGRVGPAHHEALRDALYDEPLYLHAEATDEGTRYRLANRLAARYVGRLHREFVKLGRLAELRRELASFFRAGQEEKISRAAA